MVRLSSVTDVLWLMVIDLRLLGEKLVRPNSHEF